MQKSISCTVSLCCLHWLSLGSSLSRWSWNRVFSQYVLSALTCIFHFPHPIFYKSYRSRQCRTCILRTRTEHLISSPCGLGAAGLALLILYPRSTNIPRYTIAVPSKEPVRILSPSALKFKETISPSCPFRVECSFPVSKSHNFAVWSIEPVAQRLLWGSKATVTTSFWCPAKV